MPANKNKLRSGIYWIKYNDEWIIANYYEDTKCFIRHNCPGSFRMSPSDVIIGDEIKVPTN